MIRPSIRILPVVSAVAAVLLAAPSTAQTLSTGPGLTTLALQTVARMTPLTFNDLISNPGIAFIGATDADITIVGYIDYNCGYCKKAQPEVDRLLSADAKVRVLYKDWPIFGAPSEAAARTAIAAGYQGKYQAVHNAFMQSPSRISSAVDVRRLAQAAGVDMARLERDMTNRSAEIDAVLNRNKREALGLGLQGTPAFIINGNLVAGALTQTEFQAIITRIRNAQRLR